MKGIIIDGVASSGKTTILNQIHKKIIESKPSMTKFFISEHYTERMLEHLKDKNQLDGFHVKNHIDKIIQSMTAYDKMLRQSKFNSNPKEADILITLERFILTYFTSLNIEDKYSINEARSHFKLLNKMGIKQVALVIPEHEIRERIISTLKYRNDTWKKYLYSRGDDEKIISYHIDWQKKLLNYISKFNDVIDTLVVEVKNNDYEVCSNFIFNKFFNDNSNKS